MCNTYVPLAFVSFVSIKYVLWHERIEQFTGYCCIYTLSYCTLYWLDVRPLNHDNTITIWIIFRPQYFSILRRSLRRSSALCGTRTARHSSFVVSHPSSPLGAARTSISNHPYTTGNINIFIIIICIGIRPWWRRYIPGGSPSQDMRFDVKLIRWEIVWYHRNICHTDLF